VNNDTLFITNSLTIGIGYFTNQIPQFEMKKGEFIHLKGKNGSGKTTFVKTILNEIHPVEGSIKHGIDLNDITYIKQESFKKILLPINVEEWLKIYNAIELGKTLLPNRILSQTFKSLSGGEKQKLSIISKIQSTRSLLILDEPFNHIDTSSRLEIMSFLSSLLNKAMLSGILIISHHDFDGVRVIEI